MKILRKKLLKRIFGMVLLSIMMLKVCSFFINHFTSGTDPFPVEKSTEEGKDTKEEAIDKSEKKLLMCNFYSIEHGAFTWISDIPVSLYAHVVQLIDHPIQTVPTPPPDLFA
jgi:hypothetical protein